MHIVFGHAVSDLSQVCADMGEAGAGAQKIRGQGVPGLMRNAVAEVECCDPCLETFVKPVVTDCLGTVVIAMCSREQRQAGALGTGRSAAMMRGEAIQRLTLTFHDDVVQPFGDADSDVIVAHLGLVVPEHRQPVVATEAVPADLQHFSDAAAGGDGDLPYVTQAKIVRIIDLSELTQIVLISQSSGDVIRVRSACGSVASFPAGWYGDDELAG